MFILVRHMPHLSSKVSDSPSHVAAKSHLSEESARLVAATVTILSDLPSLCSPAGKVLTKYMNGYCVGSCELMILKQNYIFI